MTQLVSLARLGTMAAFAMALASACGGQSFSGTGGDAGSSSTAGSGQGGGVSHAGSAGKAQAGSASGGSGSVGVGGTASSIGGRPPDGPCVAAPDSGMCNAYFPAWYHDPSTGICRPFAYGGCGGNLNRYSSLAECQKACPEGNPNYDACKLPSDCVVTGTGCCGICDNPAITTHDLIAYNRQYTNLFQCGIALDVAGGGTGSAGATNPGACLPCPSPPPGQGTLKYFVPNCVAGQCVVEDLRVSSVTACTNSDECKVRRGTGCCHGCGTSDDLFAARNDGSFEKLVCGGANVACPDCLPNPTGALPYCLDGRCTVAIAADSQR